MYGQSVSGQAPSAAAVGQQQGLDAALQRQAGSQATGGYGWGNVQQGAASMSQGVGQAAQMRGAETTAAMSGQQGLVNQIRARDLQSMGMSQEQALRQAELESSQRARNDEMARFYTGQQVDVRASQLQANQAYEAQVNANMLSIAQRAQHKQQLEDDKQRAYAAAVMGAVGGATAIGGQYAASSSAAASTGGKQ